VTAQINKYTDTLTAILLTPTTGKVPVITASSSTLIIVYSSLPKSIKYIILVVVWAKKIP